MVIDFVNTISVVRGVQQDTLENWMAERHLPDTATDLFRRLRDAIRAVVGAVTDEAQPRPEDIAEINRAAAVPSWPQLTDDLTSTEVIEADPVRRALAEIARSTVALLGGPGRHQLRRCQNSRCVRFFSKDHPRRESCSPACSTRTRVARHYERSKRR